MHYFLYNCAVNVALLCALPLAPVLFTLYPRCRPGWRERLGWFEKRKFDKICGARPFWIHAASVGEVFAASALIAALKAEAPECKIVVSTFTDTGNASAWRLADVDVAMFVPLDHPLVVRRALKKIDPEALIILETEIWPNLLRQASNLGIPVVLLSGRLSRRSLHRYLRVARFVRRALQHVAGFGMQSQEDAERMQRLGVERRRLHITGNLKRARRIAAATPEVPGKTTAHVSDGSIQRPLWVAGSSHRGEEEILLRVFLELKKAYRDLQLALAPRHPERFAEVEELLLEAGVSFDKKSRIDGALGFSRDLLLVDTLGDLPNLYALADVAFVGGSLVEGVGGHNLLEPASFKKPVVFGPFTDNFRALADEMKSSGGGIEVRDGDELLRTLKALLDDPDARRATGQKAYETAIADGSVVERSLNLLRGYIDFSLKRRPVAASAAMLTAHE